ncbi:hypothetical protein [Neoroseomonas lacus]|uniref:Uncharacterized protein n=1 Tax=Neoroseomonas lacus TaxID=287609 RepID=A0A917KIB0_9PROT|nr:hypothetical protein [Neoroseomonas lacus]GGJ14010.1 hypothetical protein GCM10011320_21580 [Neoroseomonas lacus]
MRLTLLRDQPAEPATIAELQRRIEDLPLGLSAIGRFLLSMPGLTADHLLTWAEACDEAAGELTGLFRPSMDDGYGALAAILRDAAPRFPHPPRMPLSAEEADASILARRIFAAGLSTAGGS